jgi:predicted Zn-dependent protease
LIVDFSTQTAKSFQNLAAELQAKIETTEAFVLHLSGEDSLFTRFNRGQVRQTGQVRDGRYRLEFFHAGKTCWGSFPCTGNDSIDFLQAARVLAELRSEIDQLPPDPYAVLPMGQGSSSQSQAGQLAPGATDILAPVAELDFTGLYAGGTVVRGYADSLGRSHWFSTETFTLDYSLFDAAGQAVKGVYAGNQWDSAQYQQQITSSRQQLALMAKAQHAVAKGKYRTYLAPAAVADLVEMLSWGGISESSMQQGQSALADLSEGHHLSPLFSLEEDFSNGLMPRFNQTGDMAPEQLSLIAGGKLVNTLVNARTAKEYGKISNAANGGESLRSPKVATGSLKFDDILKELGTGLYLSNLHYLNWSDRQSGRVTGMTRYACFWVEDGEIVAPISNLRFDASLYDFWGTDLRAVTDFGEYIAMIDSYGGRSLGGSWVPGMLIDDFTYTL